MTHRRQEMEMYKNHIKRYLDIMLAVAAFLPLCFIILIIAPAILIDDPGTVFYRAKRRGKDGKIFYMYKFRSMKMNAPDMRNADNSTFNSSNDPRVTRVGRLIRKTSIDELPQIFNVIKGDMSWIGPRASIPKDGYTWDDLDDIQKKRLTVKPGITGYTASQYRNAISRDEKQILDCYYVDHMNFLLDVKIVFWTVKTVLLRRNIYTNKEKHKV